MNDPQLFITIDTDDTDPEELADLTRSLRRELLALDVEDAEFAQGAELPEGAKSAGAINWNTVILTLIGSGGVVSSLVMVLSSWVQRNPQTKLHLSLPNGGELKIEGYLSPGSELYQQALDLMQLTLVTPVNDTPLIKEEPALVTLSQEMNNRLSLDDMKTVFFNLGLEYEAIGGESLPKLGKIQLLIKHCQRHETLDRLRQECQLINPLIVWEP